MNADDADIIVKNQTIQTIFAPIAFFAVKLIAVLQKNNRIITEKKNDNNITGMRYTHTAA
jgi:hypothetical protein